MNEDNAPVGADPEDIKTLVVAYNAFMNHVTGRFPASGDALSVWGDMLIGAQKKTGVDFMDEKTVRLIVDNAKRCEAILTR